VPGTVSGLLIPVPVSSQPTVDGVDRSILSATHSLDTVNQEPPPPPPRPIQQVLHGRSLSVDLIGKGLCLASINTDSTLNSIFLSSLDKCFSKG